MSRPQVPRRRDWAFVAWVAFVLVALVVFTAMVTAWAVRHAVANGKYLSPAQRQFVLAVAGFPGELRAAVWQLADVLERSPRALFFDRRAAEKPHWVRSFPSKADPGYLLLSGLDPTVHHSTVRLIRISDGAEVAKWDPDWTAIYARITDKRFAPRGSPTNARALNPLLLAGGDIVFGTNNALIRLGPCARTPVWLLDEPMHHSNDFAEDSVWSPSIASDGFADNPYLRDRLRDDAIARTSLDGRLLERRSMAGILRRNGFSVLLFGMGGDALQTDPVHLNEIRVARADTAYWKRGDLLLSARNLSSVFLYRPSTDKIIWHKMGPWLNQHDADFVDDHRISVFDNNVYGGAPKDQPFVAKGDINRVFVYDFATDALTQPFEALLAQAKPVTFSEGRARMLPDGGLFLEETNFGRHLRFTRDQLLWSRVNDYDKDHVGVLAWSRYLTAEEAAPALQSLEKRQCAKP